jgi:hypothetical protein
MEPGDLPSEPARWPSVLGWFSISLGGLGILKNGCGAVSNLLMGGKGMSWMFGGGNSAQADAVEKAMAGLGPLKMGLGVLSLISIGVSVLLLIAGIQLIKRQKSAVPMHVAWSWIRIFVGILEVIASLMLNRAMTTAILESMPKGPNGPPPAMMSSIMLVSGVCGGIFGLVVVLAYPIVVLAVLSRPWAKAEIARWGGASPGTFA